MSVDPFDIVKRTFKEDQVEVIAIFGLMPNGLLRCAFPSTLRRAFHEFPNLRQDILDTITKAFDQVEHGPLDDFTIRHG